MPHIQPFTPSYPIQLPQSTHSPPLHPIPASPVQASISSAACPPRALRAYSPGLCLLTPVARGQPALLVNRGLCSFLEKVDRMRTLGISSQNNHWHRKTFNIYCLCREGGKSRFQKEDPRLVKTSFTVTHSRLFDTPEHLLCARLPPSPPGESCKQHSPSPWPQQEPCVQTPRHNRPAGGQLARPTAQHYLPVPPFLPPANCSSFLFRSSDMPRFSPSPSLRLCPCLEHTSHVFLANCPSDLRANGAFSHDILHCMLGLALEQ